jgi:hypothetical protein
MAKEKDMVGDLLVCKALASSEVWRVVDSAFEFDPFDPMARVLSLRLELLRDPSVRIVVSEGCFDMFEHVSISDMPQYDYKMGPVAKQISASREAVSAAA